jgi:hypothetical protein
MEEMGGKKWEEGIKSYEDYEERTSFDIRALSSKL